MKTKIVSEHEVFREASDILLKYMEPAKLVRFWALLQWNSDYTAIRDKLFQGETVESLYQQIETFQQNSI